MINGKKRAAIAFCATTAIASIVLAQTGNSAKSSKTVTFDGPSGLYEIHIDATMTAENPARSIRSDTRHNGATGTETRTLTDGSTGRQVVQSYEGSGPTRQCIRPGGLGGLPTSFSGGDCPAVGNGRSDGSGGWLVGGQCSAMRFNAHFQPVAGSRDWTVDYKVDLDMTGGNDPLGDAQRAMDIVAGSDPTLAEKARQSLPSQNQIDAARSEAVTGMREALRDPELSSEERRAIESQINSIEMNGRKTAPMGPLKHYDVRMRYKYLGPC
ncbi:MAG: hypothetical protein ACRCY3_13960 [Sphingorhabdus sp.]